MILDSAPSWVEHAREVEKIGVWMIVGLLSFITVLLSGMLVLLAYIWDQHAKKTEKHEEKIDSIADDVTEVKMNMATLAAEHHMNHPSRYLPDCGTPGAVYP